MHSIRASMQSVSAKRLSTEQQHQQQQSITSSASALANKSSHISNKSIVNSSVQVSTAHQIQQKTFSNLIATKASTISNNSIQMTTNAIGKKSSFTNASKLNENYLQMGNYEMLSFDSLDGYDNYATATRLSSKNTFEHQFKSSTSNNSTIDLNEDDLAAAEEDEVPPALPIKKRSRFTRKDRHLSTYDNVDEADDFSE